MGCFQGKNTDVLPSPRRTILLQKNVRSRQMRLHPLHFGLPQASILRMRQPPKKQLYLFQFLLECSFHGCILQVTLATGVTGKRWTLSVWHQLRNSQTSWTEMKKRSCWSKKCLLTHDNDNIGFQRLKTNRKGCRGMHCVTKKSMDDEGLRFQIINLLKSAGASSSDRDLNNAVMNIWNQRNPDCLHTSQ